MCGIVGFSGTNKFEKNLIKLLYTYNTLQRGDDAIGLYSPENGVFKKSGKPVDILPTIDIKEDSIFMGHVRAATVGSNTDKNAHPFEFGNTIGLMNGTITNLKDLVSKYKLNAKDYSVDSEVLFAIIDKENNFDVLSEVTGGCAVLIVDKRFPDTMYVFRNSDRPLYYGFIDGSMYISSIEESLKIIGCSDVKLFYANHLYTIINGVIGSDDYKIPKPYTMVKEWDITGASKPPDYLGMKNKYLKGRWVIFDSPFNQVYKDVVGYFTKGKWYRCVGFVKDEVGEIVVIGDDNKSHIIGYNCFSWQLSFPSKGDAMMILQDITYEKGKRVLYKQGDIVYLNKYIPSKGNIFVFSNPGDESGWIISQIYVRPLSYDERSAHREKIKNSTTITDNKVELAIDSCSAPERNSNFLNMNPHLNYPIVKDNNPETVVDSETPVDNPNTYLSVNEEETKLFFESLEWKLVVMKRMIIDHLYIKSLKDNLTSIIEDIEDESKKFVSKNVE